MKRQAEYFWFRLFKTKGIGPKSLFKIQGILKKKNISPEDILKLSSKNEFINLLGDYGTKIANKLNSQDILGIKEEFNELVENDVRVVYPGSEFMPENYLKFVDQFGISPVLFCKGNISLLNSLGVSIVGSRNVSEKGIEVAKDLSAKLANKGINIISGYARGVDSIAHKHSLKAEGTTTMVLSYGILNFKLKKDFQDVNWKRDLLTVSQFIPKDKWRARNAMQRNKLVCALSNGVIVIQSGPEKDKDGKRSGTFNAGKNAYKMGLPLFVVSPDELDNIPDAVGNKDLINIGGIEINSNNAVDIIADEINSIKKELNSIRKFEQTQLAL